MASTSWAALWTPRGAPWRNRRKRCAKRLQARAQRRRRTRRSQNKRRRNDIADGKSGLDYGRGNGDRPGRRQGAGGCGGDGGDVGTPQGSAGGGGGKDPHQGGQVRSRGAGCLGCESSEKNGR